ncbi:MAG: hypothetical protein GWO07_10900 [Candidatus Dadabacteria bacterium]|nr:hypothetical protein [Candidatus Dadabacteria bacterium]NIS09248.1 hypothetical protein [Candidatus Dadabacteria bacterium]NIV41896.1 hypothetical protein [Candidatus Dadabacteria bacterium]NIX15794.1 hypothetical protein [Candidatus Dadabacteria bacterium]NIY22524.1 hypothetical protein [Candidatus Dadabacteria bacterium]
MNDIVLKWVNDRFGRVSSLGGTDIQGNRSFNRYVSNIYRLRDEKNITRLIEVIVEANNLHSLVDLIIQRIENKYYHDFLKKYDEVIIVIALYNVEYKHSIYLKFNELYKFKEDNLYLQIYIGSIFKYPDNNLSKFEYRNSFDVYLDE